MKNLVWIVLLSGLLSSLAYASFAQRLSLEQLVAQSDRIVAAQLQDAQSFVGPERTRIYTRYTFRVSDEVAGEGDALITVVQPGGAVGRIRQVTNGYPTFRAGESLTLFLRRSDQGHEVVVGLSQGVFGSQADGGRELYYQKLEGLHFPNDHGRPIILEGKEFLARIKQLWAVKEQP